MKYIVPTVWKLYEIHAWKAILYLLGVTIQLYDQRYCGFSNRVFVKVFAIRNLGVTIHLYDQKYCHSAKCIFFIYFENAIRKSKGYYNAFLTIWRSHNLWENQMLILSFDPLVWLRLMRSVFAKVLIVGKSPILAIIFHELWFYYKSAIIVICDIVKLGFKITFLSTLFLLVFYQLFSPKLRFRHLLLVIYF